MIRTTTMDTPMGPLSLLESDGTLVGGGFTADPTELHARLHPSLRTHRLTPGDLGEIEVALGAYFDGDVTAMDAVPVRQPGSATRDQLYAALRAVPAGTTVTYAELAAKAGLVRGARAAGQACAGNLVAPVVPCHRVVASGGRLNGYYYGLDHKRRLLDHERANARL